MKPISLETALQILDLLDPIALFDENGKYIYVNEPWIRNLHGKDEAFISRLDQMYPWDLVPNSRVREVLKTHESLIGEVITVDGQYAYVSYCPVMKDGRFKGVLMWELFRGADSIYKTARDSKQMVVLQDLQKSAGSDLRDLLMSDSRMDNIIGNSQAVITLKEDILAAARTNSTVLIEGETGTGKELIARAVHKLSKRSAGRFVPVNCAAIPDSLIESELFGYEEGAFTGAKRGGKEGKFELADNGTLFLDEIHQLSMPAQPKLLRVLQEREIERIGGSKAIPVDFRCIAATNTLLSEQVDKKLFRSDLYYRLNVVHIKTPPLRERKEDIPLLVDSIISQLNSRLETNIIMAGDDALNMLMEYDWPGNIRQLQNAVEAAMNRAWGGVLTPEHFDLEIETPSETKNHSYDYRGQIKNMEIASIRNALLDSHGNKAEAARKLRISRSLLYKKMQKYHIYG